MGEQLYYRDQIRAAMKMAKDNDWLNKLRRARMPLAPDYQGGMQPLGYYKEDLDKREFFDLYNFLDEHLEIAKKKAEGEMTNRARFLVEGQQADINKDRTRFGQMPILRNK